MSDSSDPKFFVPPSTSSEISEQDLEPPQLPMSPAFMPSPYPPWSPYGAWNPPSTPWTPWSSSSGTSSPWSPYSPPIHQPVQGPIISIHRHLCYNLANPTAPPELQWDVIQPPNTARIHNPQIFQYWEKPDFDADAIQPSVKKVWIDCDHQVLSFWFQRWGPVTLAAEKVTIGQVLQGIYKYLRTPLTEDDLRELNTVPGNNEALHFARAQRANDSPELDAIVLASGFRRVDVVGCHRRFQGMRIVAYPDKSWRLHFNLLPGAVPRSY